MWQRFMDWLRRCDVIILSSRQFLLLTCLAACFCTCSLFFKKEMELSLIGLQNAGKTSLVNVLTTGAFHEDMIPTVGFNMRKVTKGAVTIKLWDLGGQVRQPSTMLQILSSIPPPQHADEHLQLSISFIVYLQPRFRSMWERYCRGVQAIVYVVDAADHDGLDQGRKELHELLQKPSLARTPLLVLGNKNDLPGALSTTELIERLDLKVCRHAWLRLLT